MLPGGNGSRSESEERASKLKVARVKDGGREGVESESGRLRG